MDKKFKQPQPGTTLQDFLLHYTYVNSIVVIKDEVGWQLGITYIDHEDRFIHSLNDNLLKRIVRNVKMEEMPWANEPVISISVF